VTDRQSCRACGRALIRESRDGYGPKCRRAAEGIRAAIARAHADGIGFWEAVKAIGPPPRASPAKPHPRQIPLFD
jgi:hypothetical protein